MFHFIEKNKYTVDSLLLMDRWLIRMLLKNCLEWPEYANQLSIALAAKPYVAWYCRQRAPEISQIVDNLIKTTPSGITNEQIKEAEEFVVQVNDTSIIYTDPIKMNQNCNYIYNWDENKLFELADFNGKLVLDVGSGTGRLAFAAAKKARKVYASDPVAMLREYMKDRIKEESIKNVVVVDGTVEHIPYEDETFDIVMSGHVVGDDYDTEIAELQRVTKAGGLIIDCMGEDDRRRDKPDEGLVKRGFEAFYHKSSLGGDIYRYRKQVVKW